MKCFKCEKELDWVNDYYELNIAQHDFNHVNKNRHRKFSCMECIKVII